MLTEKILSHQDFEEGLDRYKAALKRLCELEIPIIENSRLFQYEKTLEYLANKGIGRTPQHFCDLMFDVIEADEITDIILNSCKNYPVESIKNKLSKISLGSRVRNNFDDPIGRSEQFELYINSLLNIAGLMSELNRPSKTKSPDLSVMFDRKKFDLELKRPIGNNFTRNTLRKSLLQLNKKNPGMLVVSLDHAILNSNNVIQMEPGDDFDDNIELLETEVTKWSHRNKKKIINRIINARSVCGLLLLVKAPVYSGTLHQMGFASHMRLINIKGISPSNQRFCDLVYERIGVALGKNFYATEKYIPNL